ELNLTVSDKRFKDLFFRYRARNFPETLTEVEKQQWDEYKQSVFDQDYFEKLDSFAELYKDDKSDLTIIDDLRQYAEMIVSQ
ncbi:MAG: exodeoxyribonuclease I, partial [Methylococcales bacterium]